MVPTCRYVIQIHVRTHKTTCPGLDRCMKRNQIDIAKQLLRHEGRVVVTPAIGCAVTGKMFDTYKHAVRPKLRALEATNLRLRHRGAEDWIFARALYHTAPPRVSRNINHRRERPFNTGSTRVLCCQMLCLLLDRR